MVVIVLLFLCANIPERVDKSLGILHFFSVLLSKYLLSGYHVPDAILDIGNIAVNSQFIIQWCEFVYAHFTLTFSYC